MEHIQTAKHVKKIVDPILRQRVYDLVDASGGFDNGKVPKDALSYTVDDGGGSLQSVHAQQKRG